jgi:ferredoxin
MLIGVNCTQSGGTCFCDSMGTGPDVGEGADVVLTELMEGDAHTLLVEARTAKGQMIFDKLGVEEASDDARERAKQVIEQTRSQMGRTMDTAGLGAMLRQNLEHPRWHEVAERCLACANCTMVCPTCFCSTVEDVTDLGGGHAERWRRWDSCFSLGFSYISGGRVRTSTRARYRQWLSHKLSSWVDQFGSSGCVGCGRCITWCPVGIDLTDEVAAIRATSAPIATDSRRRPHDHSKP